MAKSVAIGADHGGFILKEKIKKVLQRLKYQVKDMGTFSDGPCDYPEYGYKTAKEVSAAKAYRGIVICKTGIGMSVIANKLPRVRAGLCNTREDAISAREHNDTNVLVLAAARISEKKAVDIVKVWLKTNALGGRHKRRVREIINIEKKLFKTIK
ncbi:MAG: RpiB/LacA/LacB family sugar-phosphate isomerase [Candidatus Omnitrophica bacterium]|nr:RpiB/LacA/LacB family sugar-phosphate isomerase [Candidatus Omnitrophota bacterium]